MPPGAADDLHRVFSWGEVVAIVGVLITAITSLAGFIALKGLAILTDAITVGREVANALKELRDENKELRQEIRDGKRP